MTVHHFQKQVDMYRTSLNLFNVVEYTVHVQVIYSFYTHKLQNYNNNQNKRPENRLSYFQRVSSQITQIQEIFGRINLMKLVGKVKFYNTPTNFSKW